MTTVAFERLFSMSAFEAYRVLLKYRFQYPNLTNSELVELVIHLDVDFRSLDFEAGARLADSLSDSLAQRGGCEFYQDCIEALVLRERMIWAKTLTLGRRKLIQKLSRDEQQCFREAGLLEEPPTRQVVAWWDRVASRVREHHDQAKLEQARQAEQLTLAMERDRLRDFGIDKIPQWIAIEDNTAGYDVLSFDPGPNAPTNRLIEVKSTVCSPPRFFLSRNEWEQAKRFGSAYHFHIWNLGTVPPTLYERTIQDVSEHVPTDNSAGKWKSAEIPVGA